MRTVVVAGAMALGLATLPLTAADAGSTWRVGIKASTTQLVAGQKAVLKGHVRPGAAAAGHKVALQEKARSGSKWHTELHALVTRRGTYRFVAKPVSGRTHSYRVVMPASDGHARGVSPTVSIKVFAWQDLDDLTSVNNSGMRFGSVNINGTTYDDSVTANRIDSPATVEFNLDHDCTKVRSTFGLSDGSTTGGQAEVSVQADGSPIYSNTFDLGQSESKTLTFATAPLKIRLEAHNTSTVSGTFGYGAFGSPQALCSE
jgi:hypothetical protein